MSVPRLRALIRTTVLLLVVPLVSAVACWGYATVSGAAAVSAVERDAVATIEVEADIRAGVLERRFLLFEALHGLARHDESLASYDRALALKPDYAQGWKNRGVALTSLKRFDEAAAAFDQAAALGASPH